MIEPLVLTGKALEFANKFDQIEEIAEILDLDEEDQICLYQLNKMVRRDEVFKNYIFGCLHAYAKALVTDKRTVLLTNMIKLYETLLL